MVRLWIAHCVRNDKASGFAYRTLALTVQLQKKQPEKIRSSKVNHDAIESSTVSSL